MAVGRTFEDEQRRFADSASGREILQLTDYLGHSYQFYFTDPCWLNEGRSLIFRSQRENTDNYYRCDVDSGLITQLTDCASPGGTRGCFSPVRECLYFWLGATLHELNLATLADRSICESPDSLKAGRPAPSADDNHLFALFTERRDENGRR